MARNNVKRHEFTPEELKQIESLAARDMSEADIATLMGFSDTWFAQLLKDNKKRNATQLAIRVGKAKTRLKVKSKWLQNIDNGDQRAIEFWLKNREGMVSERSEITGNNGGPLTFVDIVRELEMKKKDANPSKKKSNE